MQNNRLLFQQILHFALTFTFSVLWLCLIVPLILSMARQLRGPQDHISRALQNAPKLRPFILSNVKPTGKKLGEGAYGCVEELEVNYLICAGKRMYETLIDPGNEGAGHMIQKYYDECQLLSDLHHPNIVQFLGICFLEAPLNSPLNLPVLVMEQLQGNLDNLLENTPEIPLAKKCSILQDVARGLLYLHSRSPVIIHRDLTARNILLNSAMVAKIADLGNSRIVDIQPGQLARTMSVGAPGTIVYMPPEVFEVPPKYGPMLDMFSFGHLTLFTAIQEFPGDLLAPNYQHPITGRLTPRDEVERRSRYMETLQGKFGGSHELVQLITQCLEYSPARRPSASEALQRLQHISSQEADHCQNITRLELEALLLAKDERMKQLEIEVLEGKEEKLLQELKKIKRVEGRKPTPPTGNDFVESKKIRYNMKYGGVSGNTAEVMILVSVGSEFPAGIQVQPRVRDPALAEKAIQTHGRLPPIVTGLHEEAAADLMARASLELQNHSSDLVRLCLDVPGKQRSKEYYLNIIEWFFKHCQQPGAVLIYLGHSEEGTGNWCFKDGTISFQEIFDLYRGHCPGKVFITMPDCCFSGNWVKDCAKTLESLGIPPCGHKVREQGILIKVFASCQPDQKAAEPCFSVEGVTVDDGESLVYTKKRISETQSCFGHDFTKLVCCRDPDKLCPGQEELKNWTWQDVVDGELANAVYKVKGADKGRSAWYLLLLSSKSEAHFKGFRDALNFDTLNLEEWGHIIESGYGESPPESTENRIKRWMDM